jgi:hypothetical protein
MSETIAISAHTVTRIERALKRIDCRLNREQLNETITEKEAAEFLEVTKERLRNMVYDGTIPESAYVTTVNSNRRYFKDKLVKL